jgi:carboxypeptidase C (cathepsin A)
MEAARHFGDQLVDHFLLGGGREPRRDHHPEATILDPCLGRAAATAAANDLDRHLQHGATVAAAGDGFRKRVYAPGMANDDPKNETEKTSEEKGEKGETPPLEEQESSMQYTGTFGRKKVAYTARAATQVFDIDDKKVSFFYVDYTKDGADPAQRPILFCFNGGPGSSTVWLNLGLFGPKRMQFDPEGFKVGMQGRLVDNPQSILDVCDVVCIDAIGTGFSTTAEKDDQKGFLHFKKDIEAFSRFIVHYLNRNNRWGSPKYLAGESYGTLRAAGIARELFTTYNVEFNGIMLISSVLNYQTVKVDPTTLLFHPGNDLPYALYLPSYAATAWYHGRLSKKHQGRRLAHFLEEVEEFALGEYWTALAQGDQLDAKTREGVAARLAEYTGVKADYIDYYDLRLHILRFCKELLRDQKRTVGRIDSRYTGIDRVPAGDGIEADPSLDATGAVAASALNQYLRQELGFESDRIYEIMSLQVNKDWDYEDFKNQYVDTSEAMREAMSRSRGTKVFVANGYFDLATPYLATEYTFSHMGLDPEVRDNVSMEYYEAGHMMYVHQKSLDALARHLREFVAKTK